MKALVSNAEAVVLPDGQPKVFDEILLVVERPAQKA